MADAVCSVCNGQRKTKLTGCPKKMVNDSAFVAMRAADFARKGVLPLSGGWLDQTDGCMKAIQFIWSIEDVFLARAGKKD